MHETGRIGTLPPGARVVELKIAALGPFGAPDDFPKLHPRTLARLCARGVVVHERRPGKTDSRGINHGRLLVAVRDNGLPIYAPAPAQELALAERLPRTPRKKKRPRRGAKKGRAKWASSRR